jgi:spore coat polysaccharide biosynthesis protein SpsF
MRVVAVVQARMGSSRLPGKVLLDLAGDCMLAHVINRLKRAKALSEVVVATTTEPADGALADLCADRGWPCFRGSENDVLDRYYRAAKERGADVVVRVTSDCPLIDPGLVDDVAREVLAHAGDCDYAANVWPRRTYPRGLDAEAFPFAALERAWREDDNPAWREHVTEYMVRHPERFRLCGVTHPTADHSGHRWTVDTPEDLEFVRVVYRHFGGDSFSWEDALAAVGRHPEWEAINRDVVQKVVP